MSQATSPRSPGPRPPTTKPDEFLEMTSGPNVTTQTRASDFVPPKPQSIVLNLDQIPSDIVHLKSQQELIIAKLAQIEQNQQLTLQILQSMQQNQQTVQTQNIMTQQPIQYQSPIHSSGAVSMQQNQQTVQTQNTMTQQPTQYQQLPIHSSGAVSCHPTETSVQQIDPFAQAAATAYLAPDSTFVDNQLKTQQQQQQQQQQLLLLLQLQQAQAQVAQVAQVQVAQPQHHQNQLSGFPSTFTPSPLQTNQTNQGYQMQSYSPLATLPLQQQQQYLSNMQYGGAASQNPNTVLNNPQLTNLQPNLHEQIALLQQQLQGGSR